MQRVPAIQGRGTQVSSTQVAPACAVYAAIAADAVVMAHTDPPEAVDVLTHLLLLSLQIFVLLAILLAYFVLTTSLSPYVQLGLYSQYLQQHKHTFLLGLAAVLLVAGVGAYRLALVYQQMPHLEMWQQPGYVALWFVQRLCLLALQCRTAHATAMSFKQGQDMMPLRVMSRLSGSAVQLL